MRPSEKRANTTEPPEWSRGLAPADTSGFGPPVRTTRACGGLGAGVWGVLIVGAWVYAAPAFAQEDCEDPPARLPVEILPSRGARDATLDSPIMVRYSEGYFGPTGVGDRPDELIRVERCPETGRLDCARTCEGEGTPVPGTVQVLGDRLYFLPQGGLAAGQRYSGVATGIEGDLPFSFCSGSGVDTRPPRLGAFVGAVPAAASSGCTLPEGGRRVGLRWEAATDPDGSAGSIEYLLFLTRGRGISSPQLRDRLRNFATTEVTLTLLLEPDEAAEPVCVELLAVDALGHVSEPGDEVCVDPQTMAVFQPLCSFRGGGAPSPWLLIGAASTLLLFVVRRARR